MSENEQIAEKEQGKATEAQPVQERKVPKRRHTPLYTIVVCVFRVVAAIFFRLRIEGRENIPKDRNCVLMGNHKSNFDPIVMALCVPDREIYFMGKKELFKYPLLAWVFKKVHAFPVDRGNMDMGAIRTAMNVLRSGETLGIFPEGKRSRQTHMLPLLGGAALLALKSGCDVVPVYIDGRYRPFERMVVRCGKPIKMDDLRTGRMTKESCEVLTGRIEEAFAELSLGKSRPAKAIEEGTEQA